MTIAWLMPAGGPREAAWERWTRPLAFGVIVVSLLAFAIFLWAQATDPRYASLWGVDRGVYRDAGLRVLDGGAWYYPEQVTGQPYEPIVGHVMYPPVSMVWLVPAALLPDLLWWTIPLGVIGVLVVQWRPSWWGWAGIAGCLAYPPTSQMLVAGNPGLWIAAAVALGTVWRPAFALVFAKPSVFPFALLGLRDRGWWAIAATGLAASLIMLPMTLQWVSVVLDARGYFSGPMYAFRDLGLVLIPLIAWQTSSSSLSRGRPRPDQ